MRALVSAAADRAESFVGLAYPRRGWWMRLGLRLVNLFQALTRSPYRAYDHPPDRIDAAVAQRGFQRVYRATVGPWDVAVFRRTGSPRAGAE